MLTFGSYQMNRSFGPDVEKLALISRVGELEATELASHNSVLNRNRRILDSKTSSFRVDHGWPEVRGRIVVLNSIDPNALPESAHDDARVSLDLVYFES